MEIFSVKTLNLIDLCSLGETCARFRQLVLRIIPKEIEIFATVSCYFAYLPGYTECSLHIDKTISTFGSNWHSIEFSQEYPRTLINYRMEYFIKVLTEHCVGNLKRLKLWSYATPCRPALTKTFKPILKQLQMLDLRNFFIEDASVFVDLNSLVELRVASVNKENTVLGNVFPNLERFAYEKGSIGCLETLSTFISHLRILKAIRLEIANISYNDSKIILQTIAESCIALEELKLLLRTVTIAALQPLESLKSLRILELLDTSFEDGLDLFRNWKELRELTLRRCRLPQDFNLDNLTQLARLEMINCNINWNELDEIMRRQNRLTDIIIRDDD